VSRPRLLLLLPTTTYRATAFIDAALRLAADLTIASDEPSTFAAAQPDRFLTLDFADPARAAEQARAFAAQYPVHGVLGVDDDTVVVAAHAAQALGLPAVSPEAALAARDKHLQRERLRQAGVPVPDFRLHRFGDDLGAAARAARYPCVLKPLRLAASRGVIRADDPAQFVAAARRIERILQSDAACAAADRFLAEDFVPGPEVALEGVVENGRLHPLALFDKPDPLDGPFFEETIYVTPSRLPDAAQRAIAACAQQAVTALGIGRGPVHAELRWNAAGAWLIELAARPIGGRCSAALVLGVDGTPLSLEALHMHQALGLPLGGVAREPGASAVMMIPTPGAGRLAAVEGQGAARQVPLVEDVVITVNPGQELVPLPEGARYLGFIFARGPDPAAVEAAVREAHGRLTVRLA
jgi:biotin carboxylase